MSDHLVPCASCARHVRASDDTCPFCGHAHVVASARPLPKRRLTRAATFAFGAALTAATSVGCSESHAPSDAQVRPDAGVDSGAIAPPYGAPADAGIAPLYGGAPED